MVTPFWKTIFIRPKWFSKTVYKQLFSGVLHYNYSETCLQIQADKLRKSYSCKTAGLHLYWQGLYIRVVFLWIWRNSSGKISMKQLRVTACKCYWSLSSNFTKETEEYSNLLVNLYSDHSCSKCKIREMFSFTGHLSFLRFFFLLILKLLIKIILYQASQMYLNCFHYPQRHISPYSHSHY